MEKLSNISNIEKHNRPHDYDTDEVLKPDFDSIDDQKLSLQKSKSAVDIVTDISKAMSEQDRLSLNGLQVQFLAFLWKVLENAKKFDLDYLTSDKVTKRMAEIKGRMAGDKSVQIPLLEKIGEVSTSGKDVPFTRGDVTYGYAGIWGAVRDFVSSAVDTVSSWVSSAVETVSNWVSGSDSLSSSSSSADYGSSYYDGGHSSSGGFSLPSPKNIAKRVIKITKELVLDKASEYFADVAKRNPGTLTEFAANATAYLSDAIDIGGNMFVDHIFDKKKDGEELFNESYFEVLGHASAKELIKAGVKSYKDPENTFDYMLEGAFMASLQPVIVPSKIAFGAVNGAFFVGKLIADKGKGKPDQEGLSNDLNEKNLLATENISDSKGKPKKQSKSNYSSYDYDDFYFEDNRRVEDTLLKELPSETKNTIENYAKYIDYKIKSANSFKETGISARDMAFAAGAKINEHEFQDNLRRLIASEIKSGNETYVKEMLENGFPMDFIFENGDTIFNAAIKEGKHEIIDCILDKVGTAIDIPSRDGFTPLHLAIERKDLSLVNKLLDKGFDINSKGVNERTALHYAVTVGDEAIVKRLIEAGASLDETDEHGQTALQAAAILNKENIAKDLLNAGADPNHKDDLQESALHYAAKKNLANIIKIFLEDERTVIDSLDENEVTPFWLAAYNDNLEAAKLLKEAGANMEFTNHNLETPLIICAINNSERVTEYLLENHADLSARDKAGLQALHHAAGEGHPLIIKLMHKFNIDMNSEDLKGLNPTMHAARNDKSEVIELLERLGANKNHEAFGKWVALHEAVNSEALETIEALVKTGAFRNARAFNGMTPMHLAAVSGSKRVVDKLLNLGLRVDVQTSAPQGANLPIHLAAEYGNHAALKSMLEYSSGANSTNMKGEAPLHIAIGKGDLEAVKILLRNGAYVDQKNSEGFDANMLARKAKQIEIMKVLREYQSNGRI